MNPIHLHSHGFIRCTGCEQLALLRDTTGNLPGQPVRTSPAFTIELAQVSDRLLHHLATAPYRADKLLVDVRLTVLVPGRMTEVHAPIVNNAHALPQQLGRHYTHYRALGAQTETTYPRGLSLSA